MADAPSHELLIAGWAAKVRQFRKEAGFSQVTFAAALGVDQTTVSRIERGKHPFNAELMVAIAAVLERELHEVFEYPPGLVSRAIYQRQAKLLKAAG